MEEFDTYIKKVFPFPKDLLISPEIKRYMKDAFIAGIQLGEQSLMNKLEEHWNRTQCFINKE